MRYLVTFLFASIFLFAAEPDAVLKVEKSVDQRTSISIVSATGINPQYSKEATRLFLADFRLSGNFVVDQNSTSVPFSTLPINIKSKSKYTLLYNFAQTASGGASLDIRLIGGSPRQELLRRNFKISKLEKAPFLIHKAVSEINKFKKFPPIEWINRYVLVSRYVGPKRTEIMLADYTFTYKKVIIKGGLNLFPIWADASQREIYYSSYGKDILTLYKLNIYTGAKKQIITTQGILACSDVSKDGSKLLLTMAPESQPDIYLFSDGQTKRLTTFSGIDVSGKFIDGEQAIVFVSNRLGSPNIFKKSIYSNSVQKIVNHGKNNSSCDTYDNMIVYSSKEGPKSYNIYLTDSAGSDTRPLTSGGINQFPRFSRDGNVVMYIKRGSGGNSIGYSNLQANRSESFKLGISRIQSIDW
jgi:TolB protein